MSNSSVPNIKSRDSSKETERICYRIAFKINHCLNLSGKANKIKLMWIAEYLQNFTIGKKNEQNRK